MIFRVSMRFLTLYRILFVNKTLTNASTGSSDHELKEWSGRSPQPDEGTGSFDQCNSLVHPKLQLLHAESTGVEPDPEAIRTHCLAGSRYHRLALLSNLVD